jgi:outer membrane protein assembly factor BamA
MRLLLILILFSSSVLYAQKKYVLSLESDQVSLLSKIDGKKFETKEGLNDFILERRYSLIKKGYVLANIDSVRWKNDSANVVIFVGPKFDELEITVDSSDQSIIRNIPGVNERLLSKVAFRSKEISTIMRKINTYLVDNGYPFAQVNLEVGEIQAPITEAVLIISSGPQVSIKEIFIKGTATISEKFVINAIAIEQGDLYNQSSLNDISSRIDQIQFLSEIKPYELLFTKEGVELYLYLESNQVSLVNGIVGLQPDPVTEQNIITGDIRLKLQNVLKRGELFSVNWRSLQPTTQDLDVRLTYPFLFNTPFGIDVKFDLYKQDSSFLTTNFNLGIQYFLRGGNYIKAFYEADNSNVLSGGINSTENYVSVSTNRYGLGVFRQQFDYLPNPSRGLRFEMELSAGQRSSSTPTSDSIVNTTTFRGDLAIEFFIPLAKRHVLRFANSTSTYYAPEIFKNEEFRFGGLQTQRGFNEEILRATTLTTFMLEYRFLVDRNSHAFAFFDQSIYENNVDGYTRDDPFGFGAGFSFGTNIGIFSISYALGKQFENPILLRDGKVHFGYVAYF